MELDSIHDKFGVDFSDIIRPNFSMERLFDTNPTLAMFICPYEKIPVYHFDGEYHLYPKGSCVDQSKFNNDNIYEYIYISYSNIDSNGNLLNPMIDVCNKQTLDEYPYMTDQFIVAYDGDVAKWDFKYVVILDESVKKKLADYFGISLNPYLDMCKYTPMENIDWGVYNAPNVNSGMYELAMYPKYHDMSTCRLDNIHKRYKVSIVDDQIVVKPINRRKEGKIRLCDTVHRICIRCGETFDTRRSDIKRGRGVFCSKSCANMYRATHYTAYEFKCVYCGTKFTTYDDDDLYCCIECKESHNGKNDVDNTA